MAYNLNYSSGTGTLTVQDNTANTQTTLVLPGANFVGYGSPVDQNMLSMLEHYASYNEATMNEKAIRGQIWYDSGSNTLKFNTSSNLGLPNWVTIMSGAGYTLNTATTTILGGIKVGSGLSITGDGTLSATGGGPSGSVTSVSVTSANGFSGTVANSTSTPAITIATTVSGLLKGNGTAISAAVAGTDYQSPLALTTNGSSGTATLIGNTLNIPQYSSGGGGGGTPGNQYTQVYLYQWAPVQPDNPSGESTFTWASATNSGYTGGNGWSVTVPSNPGTALLYLWTASKSIGAAGDTVTTTVDWSSGFTISALSQNGATGPTGDSGPKIATASVFKWALPPAPTVSGTSTYNWSTGQVTSPPSGWQSVSGVSSPGYYLYEARVQVVAASTDTTSTVDWSGASILIVGYAGDNGTGSIQSRIAYARIPGLASPIANQITVSGDNRPTQAESANSSTGWGLNYAWNATDPAPLSTTESLYVSAGIYNGTNTIWDTPYLSSLRVGQLSAITANMGTITAGSINVADKFIVGIDGTTTIKTNASGTSSQMIISNNAIKVYDEFGNLRVQIGNLAA